MSFDDEDDFDHTLLVLKECFVYKIPPRNNLHGYKAADWDINTFIWTGRCTVSARGELCTIRLEDPETGDPFAVCSVREGAVESVSDSSRYFVLKIEDGSGRHAFIGMGFTERSEAFDFNAALQDHVKYVQQKKESKLKEGQPQPSKPSANYSLAEGQKISVHIKTNKTRPTSGNSGAMSLMGGGLLPPPGSTGIKKPSGQSSSEYDFSDFTSGSQQPQQQPQQSSVPSGWVAFQ